MNTNTNSIDEKLCEQLCAYMDGELGDEQARFLERRLANEPALRAKWQRLQLASACIKGHPVQPMSANLATRIAAALAEPVATTRLPWRPWAIAASIAALAMLFAPRLLHFGSAPESSANVPALVAQDSVKRTASPSSADFIAVTAVEPPAIALAQAKTAPAIGGGDAGPRVAAASDSPTQFPLVESAAPKSWPRAELPGASNDPSIEAYLVRHNQMLANDGLGGFVPYVDVVGNDPTPAADAEGDSQ